MLGKASGVAQAGGTRVSGMCRIAAYVGPPRTLHDLWLAAPHGLVVQSYAPREMNGAILNADGFGMAWYTSAAEEPALYRTVLPLWSDENVPRMAPHLVSGCALANVRSATPGMSTSIANVSPFVRGRWSFTHNGVVRAWKGLARTLRTALDDASYASIEGSTDSEHVFALVMTHLLALADGADPTPAVRSALRELEGLVRGAGASALLNFVLTDGRWLVAVRHAIDDRAPSLYRRAGGGGLELASERLDEHAWESVAEGAMVIVTPERDVRSERL